MNAPRPDSMSALRDAWSRIAMRRATKPTADAATKLLAGDATIRRLRVVEEQIVDIQFPARLSVRKAPLDQHAVTSATAGIAIADTVGGCRA
jgi:hypothetical protein